MLADAIIKIVHMMHPFGILNQHYLFSLLAVALDFVLYIEASFIGRCIINYHDAVVGVVLLEDGVQIEVVPKSFVVVEGRD